MSEKPTLSYPELVRKVDRQAELIKWLVLLVTAACVMVIVFSAILTNRISDTAHDNVVASCQRGAINALKINAFAERQGDAMRLHVIRDCEAIVE